jgi:hypothetical protein
VSKAAGYAAGGRYADAAKLITEKIADKYLVTAAAKMAVEITNNQIESWKNGEVEAAYTAYKNGANGKFWGYSNDKGDFTTVWDQMRGIRRQLEIEAIKKENDVRKDSGTPPLTEAQADMVREGVKQSYQAQFEKRSATEDQMKAEEDKLTLLVKTFKDNNLFDSTTGPVGLDKGLDYQGKLDVLYHFAEKIMADTKRPELSDKNGLVMDGKISADDIAQGARIWFSGPDGAKKHKQFLFDRFKISLFPDLKALSGDWTNGKMRIDNVIVPPDIKEKAAAQKDNKDLEGCDFTIDFTKLIGKEVPVSLSLAAKDDASGSLTLNVDKKPQSIPFTYENGVIKAETTINGAVVVIDWTVSEDAGAYALSGTMNMDYNKGMIKIFTSVTAQKAKPAPKPVTK